MAIIGSQREFGKYDGDLNPRHGHWQVYRFISRTPLKREDRDLLGGPYPYPFYLYINPFTGNVIIGSDRYTITNAVVQSLNYHLKRNLVRNSINVDKIARAMLSDQESGSDKRFFATNIVIDVNSFGDKLESLTLSGSDVFGSGFLSKHVQFDYVARNIGLMVAGNELESVRLLNNGGIQFYTDRLKDLETCLGFVNTTGAFSKNV